MNERRDFGLPGDGALLGLIGLYIAAVVGLSVVYRFPLPSPLSILSSRVTYLFVIALVAGPLFMFHRFRNGRQSFIDAVREVSARWRVVERFRAAIVIFIMLVTFTVFFSAMKSAIPAVHPFSDDQLLARLDESLFGRDAWQVLQPLLGHPLVTFLLNLAYHTWVLVLLGVTTLALFWIERPELRLQYLLAYTLSWIVLGSLLAAAFSSVGPCFYELEYGDARFAGLMHYLQSVDRTYPLMALHVQEELIAASRHGDNSLGLGMSAMPSMHVAMSTLFALVAWRVSPRWGVAATAFLAMICVGSVHLGYHYALDGLVSIPVAAALWWASGLWTRAILSPGRRPLASANA